jgi:hypothetical protein
MSSAPSRGSRLDAGSQHSVRPPRWSSRAGEGMSGSSSRVREQPSAVTQALRSLAVAAVRHGPVEQVRWVVCGRELELAPVTPAAAPVVTGEELRDLGSLVGRAVIEALGGSLELAGDTLRVRL